MLTRTLAIANR